MWEPAGHNVSFIYFLSNMYSLQALELLVAASYLNC